MVGRIVGDCSAPDMQDGASQSGLEVGPARCEQRQKDPNESRAVTIASRGQQTYPVLIDVPQPR